MSNFWNERYKNPEFVYGEVPNEFFREQIGRLPAGKLLLPCEGEGRNAVYAARLGWDVTAFDFSEAGRDKAMALARKFGVTLQYDIADVAAYPFKFGRFDAVALIYCHFPPEIRESVHQKAAAALKPGGILILEAFHPRQIANDSGGPQNDAMLYDPEMLALDFAQLSLERNETLETELQEGAYHAGKADIIRLVGRG